MNGILGPRKPLEIRGRMLEPELRAREDPALAAKQRDGDRQRDDDRGHQSADGRDRHQ